MSEPLTRRRFLAVGAAGLAAAAGAGALAGCSSTASSKPITLSSETIPYGFEPMQKGDLIVPVEATPRPVVVLLHGGYWRVGFDKAAMGSLAEDLARRGYATWNLDYRRLGEPGGGWPGTFADVAAGIDLLATLAPKKNLDLRRVTFLGHSAGSQLAFWAAARRALPAGAPGADPQVRAAAAVSLSGVLDLRVALGQVAPDNGELAASTRELLGGDVSSVPDRYDLASPAARLPLGIPQLVIHGENDSKVDPVQSRSYSMAAKGAGDDVTYVELARADHFDVIQITKAWWDEVLNWLPTRLGDPAV
ncbi:MAG: alpha/beta hydrolase [Acidimicrobiales bacterium]